MIDDPKEFPEECEAPPDNEYELVSEQPESPIIVNRATRDRNVKTNLKLWSSPDGKLFYQ